MEHILIIEDDLTFRLMLTTWLTRHGYAVETAGSISEGCRLLEQKRFSVVLTDMRLPDKDGTELLQWLQQTGSTVPAIVMTSYAEIQNAVLSMKLGARDYIAKPIRPEELLQKIRSAIETAETDFLQEKPQSAAYGSHPARKRESAKPGIAAHASPDRDFIEGRSDAARKLYNRLRLVAPTQIPVLIQGASGTGKEHIARMIHMESKRSDKPFIAVDCGSIPRDLAGSEFFGHKKGAFTGALADKKGAFAEASGGTLFLDEIGNLGYDVQVQLLRALQEKKIRPIGANTETEVDIRLVTATNENLEAAIREGKFREDLYHRINGFALEVPELKEQKEDLLLYANFFLDRANRELDKQIPGFTPEAARLLERYDWPGNLRQMKNIVTGAVLLAPDTPITPEELPEELRKGKSVPESDFPEEAVPDFRTAEPPIAGYSLNKADRDKEAILRALEITGNNKSQASKLLGIDRKTLYAKIKLYWPENENPAG